MKIAEHNRGSVFLQELKISDMGTAFAPESASLRNRGPRADDGAKASLLLGTGPVLEIHGEIEGLPLVRRRLPDLEMV
jgi:hypothetical protein